MGRGRKCGQFDAELHIEMLNEQNVLGSLMTAVATCESNIQSIWTEELENNLLLVIIQVGARDIYHLENIMRKIKTNYQCDSFEAQY